MGHRTAHIVVIGNEKGGSGKSTTAMHVSVGLLRAGLRVAAIDLDIRQLSFTRYIENRRNFIARRNIGLPVPRHHRVASGAPDVERAWLETLLSDIRGETDAIVIDTAGSDTLLGRVSHSFADTLITPLNDSLVDFDVLARMDSETGKVIGPGRYAEMVWEQKKIRAARDKGNLDWIVMRNRLSHLDAANKRTMETLLADLGQRIGFRAIGGFGERVVYRELFLKGLTMMDLRDLPGAPELTMSQVAARQEVRALIDAIGINKKSLNVD